jgi:hypothetical protein
MPNLFGIDIAGLVDKEIAAAGGVLTGKLTKVTPGSRTSGSLRAGASPSEVSHDFRGFLQNVNETRYMGQLQTSKGEVASILGASLPSGVVPEANDKITIEGRDYDLVQLLRRDPAAALYEFEVEGE